MVTQCEAHGKKNSTINIYAGIFNNKLFRQGGRGSHSGGRSDSDRCCDESDRSLPVYRTENGARGDYPTMGSKDQLATSDDIASNRLCQSHVISGQDSLHYDLGVHSDFRKEPCNSDAELKAIPGVGAAESDMHFNAINSLITKGNIQAGKRSSTGLGRTEYTGTCNDADHNWQESRVLYFGRNSEMSERENLQGNGPCLSQEALQQDEQSPNSVGIAAAELKDRSLPSLLSGTPCRKGVNGNQMGDSCTSGNMHLQFDETSSRSIQIAQLLGTNSSAPNDEIRSLERRLRFTAIANDCTVMGHKDVGVSHPVSFEQSNVDTVATDMVGRVNRAERHHFVLPIRNMIVVENMTSSGSKSLVDTLKPEVVENDKHLNDSSKVQAFQPSRTQSFGEMSSPAFTKINKSGEYESYGRSDTNGLAWRGSPSRGHSVLASPTRIGETISLDSLSSHGGSSSSGSPLALETLKESRVSSPGDISMSKGSPYSVSSRSMGSITGYDIAVNALLSPTSSNESAGQHWQSNARRSDEMTLSGVHNGNHNLRCGGSSRKMKADGMNNSFVTTGNLSRRCQSANANGNLLHSGNLLVGGANGDVLSYNGSTKGNVKQERARQGTISVDCRLMKRALATSDSEQIKNVGNEYYKAGHFSEALILYDKAVALCPSNAVYRCNRAAALSGLERVGEAVKECEEAIRLDPSYAHAQQRAASLYTRLGMIESARQHLHDAGQDTDLIEVQRIQVIEKHLFRCIEARKLEDWHNVIKESDAAVVAGADSAPQIFGFKAEALLRLQKLQHAESVCNVAQKIESSLIELSIGSPNAYLCLTRAQVNMALGRFDEAVLVAEAGARIEPQNATATTLLRKARTVAEARTTGNEFFNAGRLFEALASYAEGLESDPTNAVLLCNRAACRLKLGQWEKAVEDCDAALKAQRNYTKARLRRASCLAKLERWEDALQDYEALKRELPGDPDVDRALFDVQVAMKKSRGEEVRGMKFGGDVEEVTSEEQFREAVGSAGLSVVQFITRWSDRCQELSPFIDDLCRHHPCVNFVKVDVEELPYLARIESITFIPTFKIYKDGQKLKELIGPSQQSLEYVVRHYSL